MGGGGDCIGVVGEGEMVIGSLVEEKVGLMTGLVMEVKAGVANRLVMEMKVEVVT